MVKVQVFVARGEMFNLTRAWKPPRDVALSVVLSVRFVCVDARAVLEIAQLFRNFYQVLALS